MQKASRSERETPVTVISPPLNRNDSAQMTKPGHDQRTQCRHFRKIHDDPTPTLSRQSLERRFEYAKLDHLHRASGEQDGQIVPSLFLKLERLFDAKDSP